RQWLGRARMYACTEPSRRCTGDGGRSRNRAVTDRPRGVGNETHGIVRRAGRLRANRADGDHQQRQQRHRGEYTHVVLLKRGCKFLRETGQTNHEKNAIKNATRNARWITLQQSPSCRISWRAGLFYPYLRRRGGNTACFALTRLVRSSRTRDPPPFAVVIYSSLGESLARQGMTDNVPEEIKRKGDHYRSRVQQHADTAEL